MSTSSKIIKRHCAWTYQPQTIPSIDYSIPLTNKLIAVNAINANKASSYDPVNRKLLGYTSLANINTRYYKNHIMSYGSGSNYNYTGPGFTPIGSSSDVTIFGILVSSGSTTAQTGVNFYYGSYNSFSIREGDGVNNRFEGLIRLNSIYYTFGSSIETTASAGNIFIVAARHKQGQQDLFVNGIKSTNSGTNTGNITYDTQSNYLAQPLENSKMGGLSMAWSRFLSDAEIAAISTNPYQIFLPQIQHSAERFSGGQGLTTRKSWFLGSTNPVVAPNSSEYTFPKVTRINPKFNFKNVIIASNGWKDKYTEFDLTLINSPTKSVTLEGDSFYLDKTSQQTINSACPNGYSTYTNRYSFVVVVKSIGTDSNYSDVFNAWYSGTQIQLRHSTTDWIFYHNAVAGWTSVVGSSKYVNNTTQVLVGTWDGTNIKLWIDGKYINSTACSGWYYVNGPSTINIGSDIAYGAPVAGTYFDGHINLVAFSDRCWNDNEAQQISANPWQILEKPLRKVYVDNSPKKLYAPALVTSKKTTVSQPQYKAAVKPYLNLSSALIPIGNSFVDCCTEGKSFYGPTFASIPGGIRGDKTSGLSLPGYFQKGTTWTRIFVSHGIVQASGGTISSSGNFNCAQLQVNNTNLALNAAGNNNYLNASLDFTKLQKVVVTCTPTRQAIFANGNLVSSRNGSVSFTDGGTGNLFVYGSEQLTPGGILLHADSSFAFNDALACEISINPWQIFQQPYNLRTFKEAV